MSNEINHNPANDYPIGRLHIDSAEDTEGHVRAYLTEGEDAEVRALVEDADTEGHVRARQIDDADAEVRALVEDADTEGHIRAFVTDDDDTEGHLKF